MSLSASMWSSVSGLLTHGDRMNTIGNNIANINTVGFKGARMDFQDILYTSIGTNFGGGQIGGGVGIGIVMNDFSQGSFETTTSALDIAISGNGFFQVSPLNSSANYYTRAGNFSLTKEGYVVDSNGYALQGWSLGNTSGKGATTDVKLDTATCQPKHTTEVDMQINLPASGKTSKDATTDPTDPFFALLKTWDATEEPPLGSSAYAFQTTLNVYDEGGTMHTLTVYFDKVSGDTLADGSSETYWEYVVTMDPAEDVRDFSSGVGDVTSTPDVPDELKGLLAAGTLTFNSSGQITDMTCFVPNAEYDTTTQALTSTWWDSSSGSAVVDLDNWVAAPVNSDGLPVICPNFSGTPGLSTAYSYDVNTGTYDYTKPSENADNRLIALDLGLRSTSTTGWQFANTTGTGSGGLVSASDIGDEKVHATGFGNIGERSNTAMTCQGDSYQEYNLAQNGYTFGYLSSLSVSDDGIISGVYSNGKTLELYQIALYNFPSLQNLRHEGNNLFSETAASGMPVCGEAGSGQFGTTESYRLEQSNVDLSTEFVNMITTQRGFQANSKSITTVDTMLETVISMKR